MGRPKIKDRKQVKSTILTLKLTKAERERLAAIVDARAAELRTLTGQEIQITASSMIRWLIEKEAVARKL